jgi:release factor glutamine methyltransferase
MTLTLKSLVRDLETRLGPVVQSPEQLRAEVRLLVETLLDLPYETVLLNGDGHVVESEDLQRLFSLIDRRVQERIPVQYLLGSAGFYGLTLQVTPAVLIPRPETELLVEAALQLIRERGWQEPDVFDLCTGSGAIAIALGHRLEGRGRILASDISERAVDLAIANARQLGANNVSWRIGDLWSGLQAGDGPFDLIVSNPPYIGPEDYLALPPEIQNHEPAGALLVPEGATAFYERIAAEVYWHLKPHGVVMVEIGHGLGPVVIDLFENAGLENIRLVHDYAGLERIVVAEMP